MDNTGFNVFSYINKKTKRIEELKMSYGQSWNTLKTGDEKLDSIFLKADINNDGIAQSNEINILSKLMNYADSFFKKSTNDGVIDIKELNILHEKLKNNEIDINNIPETNQDSQYHTPWSEGTNRVIKTIYLSQRAGEAIEDFETIKKELTEIGEKENFEVKEKYYGREPWAEDAEVNRADGKTYVQYYNEFSLHQNEKPIDDIAKTRKGFNIRQGKVARSGSNFEVQVENSDRHIGTSYLEGGNVLQTINSKGEAGAIVGDMSVAYTLSAMNLDNTPENNETAKKTIVQDLGIKQENLTIIPQYDFHIDMCYRPLGDGEVAVPDYDEGIKSLKVLIADENVSAPDKNRYAQMLEKLETKKSDTKEIELRSEAENRLRKDGYKIIKIPDFGNDTNYMNSVTATSNRDNKTFLITNKSGDERLDEIAKKYYQEAGIDRVYFVSTQNALKKFGGIDCLTNESGK